MDADTLSTTDLMHEAFSPGQAVCAPDTPQPAEAIPRAFQVLLTGMERGIHVGAQVHIRHRGQVVADFGVGLARPGVALTPDHIIPWLSAGKPLLAVLLARFWEEGWLDIDEPVAAHVPEFAQRGKGGVTIRHLLTHTSGVPAPELDWYRTSWDQVVSRICYMDYPAGMTPGEDAAYEPQATWFILGEILRRTDMRIVQATASDTPFGGRPLDVVLREWLFEPLGMRHTYVGIHHDLQRQYGDLLATMYETLPNQPEGPRPATWESPTRIASVNPSGNARGPARELAQFYEMLAGRGIYRGARILRGPTVEALTARTREGRMDRTMRHRIDYGLGFIIDSNRYGAETVPYGYGRYASPRTYGHGGMQCASAYCDPTNDLVVAAVFNGQPGEPRHNARARDFNSALYRDLGLVSAEA